jgi:hypothetical protein
MHASRNGRKWRRHRKAILCVVNCFFINLLGWFWAVVFDQCDHPGAMLLLASARRYAEDEEGDAHFLAIGDAKGKRSENACFAGEFEDFEETIRLRLSTVRHGARSYQGRRDDNGYIV